MSDLSMSHRQFLGLVRAGLSLEQIQTWPKKSLFLAYTDYRAGASRPLSNAHSPAADAWEFLRRLYPNQVAEMEQEASEYTMAMLGDAVLGRGA